VVNTSIQSKAIKLSAMPMLFALLSNLVVMLLRLSGQAMQSHSVQSLLQHQSPSSLQVGHQLGTVEASSPWFGKPSMQGHPEFAWGGKSLPTRMWSALREPL
jgi:hypothetical protein